MFFIFLSTNLIFSQSNVNFSQIAFDYYKVTLQDNNIKDKIRFCSKIQDFTYFESECLKDLNININDTAATTFNKFDKLVIPKGNKSIKKVKSSDNNVVYITPTFNVNHNQNVVTIVEKFLNQILLFYVEMNNLGEVKTYKKCKIKN